MTEQSALPNRLGLRMLYDMMNSTGFISYESSPEHSPIRKRSVSPESRKGEIEILPYERFNGWRDNYSKIADKNAKELIKQEDQARSKMEKKKAKKERQKQKKQGLIINISTNDKTIENIISPTENLVLSSDNKEDEAIDINAAFVTKAIKKVKHSVIREETKNKKDDKCLNSLIKNALDYENKQHYKEAIQNLSEAINLEPKRFDLILKRSYLYYQLAKFEKSIRDAQKVLQYSPNNIEGYYRLAEGQFAMNNLPEAEKAFLKLLSLKAYVDEANKRIFSIRLNQLEEMGYHPNEAYTALLKSKNKSLDEAIEFLAALEEGKNKEDLYYSDEEDSEEDNTIYDSEEDEDEVDSEGASGPLVKAPPNRNIVVSKYNPLLTDPSNPFQCCSLFIGNLKKDITYKEVEDVFIKFGTIKNIRLVTDNGCYGFVNFEDSCSAGRAMEALQGSRWLLSTIPLVIRYPINVINNTIPTINNPELLKRLGAPLPRSKLSTVKPPDNKSSGINVILPTIKKPVIPHPQSMTDDCYFWSTTGCIYGDKCFNLHRPEIKGIALNSKRLNP